MHIGCLLLLLAVVWVVWRYLGSPQPIAFWCAVAVPVVHQVFVWLAWRVELQSAGTSKLIGFDGYIAVFFLLFGGRFIALLAVAWLDRGSLGLDMAARVLAVTVLTLPGLYAMYSVHRYFGMPRASGADHFDRSYRDEPLVTEGIFRFTNNGMYLYAFLLFWAVAVAFNSSAALVVAAFSHAYIWVHYFATEKPDMVYLYASQASNGDSGVQS
ncbi:hypothetical protein DRQ32_01425 [bacterium]|nr:MAG: hypothetical protein DRQ32_01425 [bacterium]